MRQCNFPDCTAEHVALGLCSGHYQQHRAQRPLRKLTLMIRDEFRAYATRVEGGSGCWIWLGVTNWQGYGKFRETTAHRYAWALHHGQIPPGKFVLHRCDNRRCVNPRHLFLGTHDDNMADMARKGRAARGSHNGNSRLTEAAVSGIKARLAQGEPGARIARDIGVSTNTVCRIGQGLIWRHVA